MSELKDEWRTGTPDVKPKHRRNFLVTCERGPGCKRYVVTAAYANEYWLEWADGYDGPDIDDEGGKKWTGWMEDKLDYSNDEVSHAFEGRVIAWRPYPEPFDGVSI